tara:strand:- start:19826 stop:22453 length:2628 start_codon:yes stop_codon:yes gene_type:complete
MKTLPNFDSKSAEKRWYKYWLDNGYFNSKPDNKKPYTIVIPPPNVTGVLHMGHMLNNSLQDILIRRARMMGYNACWIPGTDHASIATEAKVVEKLKNNGIDKKDISREEFLNHAWDWTEQYGGIILDQLKRLGCSCDWNRTKFTLDPDMYKSVIKVFINLYNKGLIYKGFRMVNWDPDAQTTLSDEEVIYKETEGTLYYISYKIKNEDNSIIIATTRPETILGDSAICINPKDKRFTRLHGKSVIVPIVGRTIPVILDSYVDPEFGTGCLKVTPAHDPNDKNLGEKHKLEFIDIFNPDGTLNSEGLHYQGQDRFIVRKKIVEELKSMEVLIKKEKHIHKVGTSERTKAIIEPRISEQWFLKMKDISIPAINAVLKTEEVRLIPNKFNNTYRHWMENITDWNISRQLWWGHRIPAYYFGKNNDFVIAESLEKALELAISKTNNKKLTIGDLKQDEDVLDTWFSSWLWPITVFDGIIHPDNSEMKYYYPTQDLVTGPDILFFWVARMIIAGYNFQGKFPFSNVYLTGLVRDKDGKKMSKQLGNSPDAIKLIENYGADSVRVGLMLSSVAGNDLLFDEDLCKQGKNFANKIWNSYRLISGWKIKKTISQPKASKEALEWYSNKFNQALIIINDYFDKYRVSDALMTVYKLIWEDFCSWLLEVVKPDFQSPIDLKTFNKVNYYFEENLKLLHPFMPFISEELWQKKEKRNSSQALIITPWPKAKNFDIKVLESFEIVKQIVGGVRNFRKEYNIGQKLQLDLFYNKKTSIGFSSVIIKLAGLKNYSYTNSISNLTSSSFRVIKQEFFIPIEKKLNIEEERNKLISELNYLEGFLNSSLKKLSDKRFINNAPNEIILLEKRKVTDAKEKIKTLKKSISNLN